MSYPVPVLFAPCDSLILDAFTQKISLIGVVDTRQPLSASFEDTDYKFLVPQISVISMWWRTPDSAELTYVQRLIMKAPDDRQTIIGTDIEFTMNAPYHRIFSGTANLALRMSGTYWLELYVRSKGEPEPGNLVAKYPFLIEDVPRANLIDRVNQE